MSLLVFATMTVAAIRVGAEPRERTVTEPDQGFEQGHAPETTRGRVSTGEDEVGLALSRNAQTSGSVTVGLYRGHTAAFYAARFRHRTKQLQAARHRIAHLKHQLRERHTSSSAVGLDYWIGRQIWAANQIGGHGTDPWPNCPDPFDGGGSWQDTVNCENGGNWLDSPGFYRCGLQFDPMWERRYGRLCP